MIKLGNKIAETYPGKEIHIILDNARYQHCNAVISHFESLGIHLEFLPSYSPNLNLIERVWKLVKSELRKTVYYDFKKFCTSIDEIIASSQTTRKAQFDSIIKEKIQLFRNMKSIDDHTMVSEKKDA